MLSSATNSSGDEPSSPAEPEDHRTEELCTGDRGRKQVADAGRPCKVSHSPNPSTALGVTAR